jgi:hypothetical protein
LPLFFCPFRHRSAFGIAAAVCTAFFLFAPCVGVFCVVRYVAPVTRGVFAATGRKLRVFGAFLALGVYLIGRDHFRAFLGRFLRSPFRVPSRHRQHRATARGIPHRREPTEPIRPRRKLAHARMRDFL